MLPIASPREISAIALAGRAVDAALAAGSSLAFEGATPTDLAIAIERTILAHGAEPVLKGFAGTRNQTPFPSAACICVNEQVVHAVPTSAPLRAGDIITIDTAAAINGWHADAATTIIVPPQSNTFTVSPSAQSQSTNQPLPNSALALLARTTCDFAISLCNPGTCWSHIAARTSDFVRSQGGSLIAGYHGHGISRTLHAAPTCWFAPSPQEAKDASLQDFVLLPGMVLCIEPIVSRSKVAPTLIIAADSWSVLTRDRSPAAFVERCIAITRNTPRVLAG